MRRRGFLLIGSLSVGGFFLSLSGAGCQAAPRMQYRSPPFISGKSAAAAGFILAAAFFGDEGLRREARVHRGVETSSMAQVGNMFGDPRYVFPALGAAYLAGHVAESPTLRRATLRAGRAAIVASGITTVLKYAIGRGRPGKSDDGDLFRPFSGWNAFPSGHTTFAFAVATTIADETPDRWSDAALYAFATLTAFARVSNDRHWTSDVIVGALAGHLTARWLSRRQGWLTVRPGALSASIEF